MLQISGVGRLGKDPSMKYTPKGDAVTNFSVAVETGYGENKQAAWVNLACFGKTAEFANQYLAKGSRVYFTAKVKVDKTGNPRIYTKQDGSSASVLEAIIQELEVIDWKKGDDVDQTFKKQTAPEPEEF